MGRRFLLDAHLAVSCGRLGPRYFKCILMTRQVDVEQTDKLRQIKELESKFLCVIQRKWFLKGSTGY